MGHSGAASATREFADEQEPISLLHREEENNGPAVFCILCFQTPP